MLALFTDFGADDIYVGQVRVALLQHAAAGTPIIDVLHTAPNYDSQAGAHLLAALARWYPPDCVFLAVVDPGVGSERDAVVLQADGQWFVGPDNGLLSIVAARAARTRAWRIKWRPAALSASFHGRDLFAPIAAWVSRGELPPDKLVERRGLRVQLDAGDLAEVIYVDHYGNALTGLRAGNVPRNARLGIADADVEYARVFSDAMAGQAFWYENSIGLVEIAVNRGSAALQLGISVGDPVHVIGGGESAT
ncbi:SAM hydrolase/SAM-dependent halogenase family protein [Paraburkholderia flagellata]|uniref:SAM hydrolase/SAM-dependent halogenase family protein n=1 Tax=Paraburkholderia flagellata TaxID=2883241 RepID=UPI001F29A985|nr:SAM-dependent chlorinase/fluorinase [Paraburkholderia flagellata]